MKKAFIMDFQPTVGRIPKKKKPISSIHIFSMGCLDSPNKSVKKVTNKSIFKSLWE